MPSYFVHIKSINIILLYICTQNIIKESNLHGMYWWDILIYFLAFFFLVFRFAAPDVLLSGKAFFGRTLNECIKAWLLTFTASIKASVTTESSFNSDNSNATASTVEILNAFGSELCLTDKAESFAYRLEAR